MPFVREQSGGTQGLAKVTEIGGMSVTCSASSSQTSYTYATGTYTFKESYTNVPTCAYYIAISHNYLRFLSVTGCSVTKTGISITVASHYNSSSLGLSFTIYVMSND